MFAVVRGFHRNEFTVEGSTTMVQRTLTAFAEPQVCALCHEFHAEITSPSQITFPRDVASRYVGGEPTAYATASAFVRR
jgi:cytochrome c551/c552